MSISQSTKCSFLDFIFSHISSFTSISNISIFPIMNETPFLEKINTKSSVLSETRRWVKKTRRIKEFNTDLNHVELSDTILFNAHWQRNSVLLDQHFNRWKTFPGSKLRDRQGLRECQVSSIRLSGVEGSYIVDQSQGKQSYSEAYYTIAACSDDWPEAILNDVTPNSCHSPRYDAWKNEKNGKQKRKKKNEENSAKTLRIFCYSPW